MKRLFFALLFLIFIASGVLFWLMKTMSAVAPTAATAEHASAEHEAGGEEHASNKAPTHEGTKHEEAKETEAVPPLEKGPAKFSVVTLPVAADVYVDDHLVGKTPIDIELKKEKQNLRLEAEGFNSLTREIPALGQSDEVHHLSEKITLRAKKGSLSKSPHSQLFAEKAAPKPEASAHGKAAASEEKTAEAKGESKEPVKEVAESAPVASKKKAHEDRTPSGEYWSGHQGPFFVQLKALPAQNLPGVAELLKKYRVQVTQAPVGACRVKRGANLWARFLVGPFADRKSADAEVETLRAQSGEKDAFVAGAQDCQ